MFFNRVNGKCQLNENTIVVNVGRIPTIDEDALINCLREKLIAGARPPLTPACRPVAAP